MAIIRRSRRRLFLVPLVTSAVAVTMLALTSASPAFAAQQPTAAERGANYLALGDSVAFGYRPSEVTPPADYLNAANFVGYPEDYANATAMRLANATCPGETTASMITPGAQSNGCENSVGSAVGYRTLFPLHVTYTGTQLDYAVRYLLSHPRTRLVTIDIGANDLFVCKQVTADHCTGADFRATLDQISHNLTTIYAALRDKAHYHHDLMLVSYYALDYRDPTGSAEVQALNTALTGPTEQFGGTVADGFTAFQLASQAHGGDPCAAGLLIPLPGGGCDVHPTAEGHQVLAAAIGVATRNSPAGRTGAV